MLKILIVDDEKLARMELVRLLSKIHDVEIVGEAINGKQALSFLETKTADLVLLDIKMPDMDGIEFAKACTKDVTFAFCTAYNEHAVEAFELNAFDYIMKPVVFTRLESLINKVRLTQKPEDKIKEPQYLPDDHGLLLKFGHDYKIVKVQDINHIESVGNHVALHTSAGKTYLHISLSKIEKKLNPKHFFKASRSEIIKINNIKKIEEGMCVGTLNVILCSGKEVEVSRRQANILRKNFSLDVS